ncbi:hypothetical protein MMO38_14450 [Acinetobacter sp. NIPH 1852]|uniref:hypothetical protein n=1 Tax=Acinetobacter sp. NIPH 1852 TaxID=2923428 RepID=UPI001F4A62B3|nr:hypothetical protein [Acinetobacter sp. NIPH 1852]MCH7309322.1 hypothetical protein [Acinetobacter sp. NIPH 1852]
MDIGRKKLLLDYLERDGTKEFSFYGWTLGLSILLLFINCGVYTKSNIGTFFDATFAVLNFTFIFLIFKKIFTLKNELSKFNQEVNKEKESVLGKIIGYLLILFIFLLGVFLVFYFSDKSAYVYTVYSLGLSFMIISIFLFYFSITKKS